MKKKIFIIIILILFVILIGGQLLYMKKYNVSFADYKNEIFNLTDTNNKENFNFTKIFSKIKFECLNEEKNRKKELAFTPSSANDHYYFDQLTTEEQDCYITLAAGCRENISKIQFDSIDKESFYTAQIALLNDHPEFFWINNFQVEYTDDNSYVSVIYDTKNIQDKTIDIENITDQIISSAPNSIYEKLKYFYDYIVDNTHYGYTDDHTDQDIRSVFLEHQSVCAGYSKAFKYLCDKAGIDCIYITGDANNSSHAWNAVKFNDKWYWVDCTWGDPVYLQDKSYNKKNYDYFLIDDDILFNSHKLNGKVSIENYISKDNIFSYPNCKDNSFYYYSLINSYFTSYDKKQIEEHIFNELENNNTIIFKFSKEIDCKKFVNDIFNNKGINDILRKYYKNDNKEYNIKYTYLYSKVSNLVELTIEKD